MSESSYFPEPAQLVQPLSVQLFSVRRQFQSDPEQTLDRLKSLGFSGVEPFFFEYNQEAAMQGIKPIAGSALRVPSLYSAMPDQENLPHIRKISEILGATRVVSGISRDDCANLDALRAACEKLNAAADLLQEVGLTLCVHNHNWEFQPIDGRPAFEHMLEYLQPTICFEMDVWWVLRGGGDPAAWLARLGKRVVCLHLKDGHLATGKMCALGAGDVDWDSLFEHLSGRELIIEIDDTEGDMFDALEQSVQFFQEMWKRADITAHRLKERVAAGESLLAPYIALAWDRAQIRETYRKTSCDLAFIDLQHAPYDEAQLVDFCTWTNRQGVPVLLRIRSPHDVPLIGRYCDFGASAIIVPMSEDPEMARAAVQEFHYPPRGRRSWGPSPATQAGRFEGFDYAPWWNANGLLILQLESVQAIRNCRELCVPGVDMLTFGGADLGLSIAADSQSPWPDVEACIRHVAETVADLPVRVVQTKMPFGKL